ncbi:ARM repeat superfamily protein [Raphanus sativus]|nr:ARM repeat superfamily protein [Raphanus sativus]
MVRSQAPAKKQQKIDFKKIKRKLGRKLPPPKNATNTEIKSKAIIIREQSVAADKDGFATSHKNATLQELLRQITHPNAKVRKNALLGIQDIFKSHPAELQSNKYTIVGCLKGRICDVDKHVRTAVYKLFETHIFPFCKEEDNQRIMVLLLRLSIFLAMADSLIDVRLMAFDFLHLVVEYYPPTFFLYAEKILENYKDIINQINHFYVQDKLNLKVVLSGLTHCLSLLPCDESDAKSHKEVSVCILKDRLHMKRKLLWTRTLHQG